MKILEFFTRSLSIFNLYKNNDIHIFKDYDNVIIDSLHQNIQPNKNHNITKIEYIEPSNIIITPPSDDFKSPCITTLANYKYNENFKLLKRDTLKYQKQVDVNILSLYYDHFCLSKLNQNNVIKMLILDNIESKMRWLQIRINNNNDKLSKLQENSAYFKKYIELEIKSKGMSKKLQKVENERTKYFESEIKEIKDRIDLLRLKFNIIENIKYIDDVFNLEYINTYLELFTNKGLYYNKILKEKKICCCHKNS